MSRPNVLRLCAALTALSAIALAACGSPTTTAAPTSGDASTSASAGGATTGAVRIALTYDGGLYVLDAQTLELRADIPLAGFNRVNAAGNGQHILVSTEGGFRVLDTGAGTATEPQLTDLMFTATTPGHVVRHAGQTVLFDDGTGNITTFASDELTNDALPATEVVPSEASHHGVAILLTDGTLLSTLGDAETRRGIRVLGPDGQEVTRNEDCPAVHGEGAAADEAALFGCSNGSLLYHDGTITKLTSPDPYGRIGNQYVTETSPIAGSP